MRLVHLMRASDVLQLLNIVKNRTAVRLTWAASVVATVWMCGASMFYMVLSLSPLLLSLLFTLRKYNYEKV